MSYYPYVGTGKVYMKREGAASGFIEIGNASKLELQIKDVKKDLRDYTKPGGGIYASMVRIDSVTAVMTLHDLDKGNVAKAVFGSDSSVTGTAITDEVVTAYKGALCPLLHPAPTAVTVTNSGASTTYVANTDYEVRPGGIFILAAGAITDAQSIKVDYTFATYDKVEALTAGALIFALRFEGLNEANSGAPVIVDVFRLQLSPAKALDLIGDDFAKIEVEGTVLKDTSKTGVGISQYFKVSLT